MFDADNLIPELIAESSFSSSVRVEDRDDFSVSRLERQTRLIVRDISSAGLKLSSKHSEMRYDLKHRRSALSAEGFRQILAQMESYRVYAREIHVSRLKVVDAGLVQESTDVVLPLERDHDITTDEQKKLVLSGGFSPSRELTEFWIRGVESYQAPNSVDFKDVSRGVTREIQADFAKALHDTVSTYAQQLRYETTNKTIVLIADRFSPALQTSLVESFQIIPDESTDFLKLLLSELTSAIRDGVEIAGAWGSLVFSADEKLTLSINEPFFATDSTFVKADEIE